jgi:FkbM family methyltransferase
MKALKSMARSISYGVLDVATGRRGIRRVIGGEPMRFPARWCRYYEPTYEPDTFQWLRRSCRPGGVAMDAGAHIGLFSVVMARLVGPSGRVFSFEPTPFTRRVLEETVRLNKVDGVVEVRGEAVSRSSGVITFFDTGDVVSNANSLVKTDRSKHEVPVETVSIDDFADARNLTVSCLKIDVEGAELDVLEGARRTFERFRPATHLALHPPTFARPADTLGAIWDTLRRYGMSVQRSGRQVNEASFCAQQNLFDVELEPEGAAEE